MWPVWAEEFNFEFLINDVGGEIKLITSFLHILWANLGVLIFIGKVQITSLRTKLDLVNVAIIG